jgi:8-hydroxy-5-deazaflavin:NADPH oxidoreductase
MEVDLIKIGILGGTGALGAALAGRLAKAGYDICIGSRDPAKAEAAATALRGGNGAQLSGAGLVETAERSDILFVTVPYAAHSDTLSQIRDAIQGKIVVDATVPLIPPKVGTVQLPSAGCAALEAAAILGPKARLVSALQNIGAEKLASGDAIDADVFIASDDAEAAEVVRSLLSKLDIRGWHVGPLANSAAAEALTSVLIQLNRRYNLIQAGIRVTGKVKDST